MTAAALATGMRELLGAERVSDDAEELARRSADLAGPAPHAAAVLARPADTAQLAAAVGAAHAAGAPVVARGAGGSYVGAHPPAVAGALLLDLRDLTAVAVHPEDLRVTAGAGVTWAALDAALAPHGLRIPCRGPLSGARATVGGGLSQTTVFHGSAAHGAVADAVLGLEVVLADGRLLPTGAGAHPHGVPFSRHHGPDLTGLFLGDAGTLGIKAAASLALVPVPGAAVTAAFAAPDAEAAAAAAARIARLRLASDIVCTAGEGWTVHVICEGHDAASAVSALALVAEAAALPQGASPLADDLHADPFGVVMRMFPGMPPGHHLPVHAHVPLSRAPVAAARLEALLAARAAQLVAAGIVTWSLTLVVGRGALVECGVVATAEADPRDVAAFRAELAALWEDLGAVHLQHGRLYPYASALVPAAQEAHAAIAAALDPGDRLNPLKLQD